MERGKEKKGEERNAKQEKAQVYFLWHVKALQVN